MRMTFDDALDDPFIIDLHGERIDYGDCISFARNVIPRAQISDEVLQTPSGRFLRLTVAADEENPRETGRYRGWYVALWIEYRTAEALRTSWTVLEKQLANRKAGGSGSTA